MHPTSDTKFGATCVVRFVFYLGGRDGTADLANRDKISSKWKGLDGEGRLRVVKTSSYSMNQTNISFVQPKSVQKDLSVPLLLWYWLYFPSLSHTTTADIDYRIIGL